MLSFHSAGDFSADDACLQFEIFFLSGQQYRS